jgi:hypothetical protein
MSTMVFLGPAVAVDLLTHQLDAAMTGHFQVLCEGGRMDEIPMIEKLVTLRGHVAAVEPAPAPK